MCISLTNYDTNLLSSVITFVCKMDCSLNNKHHRLLLLSSLFQINGLCYGKLYD